MRRIGPDVGRVVGHLQCNVDLGREQVAKTFQGTHQDGLKPLINCFVVLQIVNVHGARFVKGRPEGGRLSQLNETGFKMCLRLETAKAKYLGLKDVTD